METHGESVYFLINRQVSKLPTKPRTAARSADIIEQMLLIGSKGFGDLGRMAISIQRARGNWLLLTGSGEQAHSFGD